MKSIYDVVANNIKYYRKLKGYTQKELAIKTGYSYSYIRRIEAPNTQLSFPIYVVEDIAIVLDINLWVLFYERKKNLNYEFLKHINISEEIDNK